MLFSLTIKALYQRAKQAPVIFLNKSWNKKLKKYYESRRPNAPVNKARILTGYLEAEKVTFLPDPLFSRFIPVRIISVPQT